MGRPSKVGDHDCVRLAQAPMDEQPRADAQKQHAPISASLSDQLRAHARAPLARSRCDETQVSPSFWSLRHGGASHDNTTSVTNSKELPWVPTKGGIGRGTQGVRWYEKYARLANETMMGRGDRLAARALDMQYILLDAR